MKKLQSIRDHIKEAGSLIRQKSIDSTLYKALQHLGAAYRICIDLELETHQEEFNFAGKRKQKP